MVADPSMPRLAVSVGYPKAAHVPKEGKRKTSNIRKACCLFVNPFMFSRFEICRNHLLSVALWICIGVEHVKSKCASLTL